MGHLSGKTDKDLIEKLFNANYSKTARPVKNATDVVVVEFVYYLMRIVNVDEKHQTLTTVAGLVLNWTDVNLTWDPEEYDNVTKLWVNSDDVWLPDVVLWNNADSDSGSNFMSQTTVILEPHGMVTYDAMVILKSFCAIEFFKFPMDEQYCDFQFGPWRTNNDYINFIFHDQGEIADDIPQAGEWKVDNIKTSNVGKEHNQTMDKIIMTILLKRQPLFYVVNLIIPCLIIFALTLLGFSLPCDSGEKIGLSITILLSMAVFLTMSGDMMPPTAKDVPIISQFLIFTMVLVATSTGMNVIVLKFWHHGPDHNDVPTWLRKITMNKYVLNVLCMKEQFGEHEQPAGSEEPVVRSNVVVVDPLGNKVVYTLDNDAIKRLSPPQARSDQNTQTSNDTASVVNELKKIQRSLDFLVRRCENEDHENDVSTEWKQVACVIDRLFLWFFIAFSLAMFMALAIQMLQEIQTNG
ncbi:neuronal acetylcholine receptor subunit beta-4-like [Glandiceps talaboti]